MVHEHVLVVEDEADILELVTYNLTREGYRVIGAASGEDGLKAARAEAPQLILLDLMLPGIDGLDVCKILKNDDRTGGIPIIMLTAKGEEADIVAGLELGADDYITKPFDIEELKLRVQRAITRAEQQSLTDPRSGLPSGRLIEEQLRRIIRQDGWALMDVRIKHFEPFKEVYGFVAADDMLRFSAMLISEVVDEFGTSDDFIGHAGGDNFIIVTSEEAAHSIAQRLQERFSQEVLSHYSFLDREQGYIVAVGTDGQLQQTPLMTLAVGAVSPSEHDFADIREITELAAEARRLNS
jgi:PleD family two-component response regulator